MGDPAVNWTLTTLFAVSAAYCLSRVIHGYSWIDRVHNAAHLAMSLAMLAMPWAWYAEIPTLVQVAVFALAAAWYIGLGVSSFSGRAAAEAGHHHRRWFLWYHAAMMAAMVWMAIAMTPAMPATGDGSGMGAPDPHSGARAPMMTGMTPWGTGISIGAGIFFTIAAAVFLAWFIVQAMHATRPGSTLSVAFVDTGGYVVMAAGMALAFLVLMT